MRTLSDLIQQLEQAAVHDSDMPVMLDGSTGLGFSSWRGIYKFLSLRHGATLLVDGTRTLSVGGYAFESATASVPLYADEWGSAAGRVITGLTRMDDRYIITAVADEDEADEGGAGA